jgi:hypothetical protein
MDLASGAGNDIKEAVFPAVKEGTEEEVGV